MAEANHRKRRKLLQKRERELLDALGASAEKLTEAVERSASRRRHSALRTQVVLPAGNYVPSKTAKVWEAILAKYVG